MSKVQSLVREVQSLADIAEEKGDRPSQNELAAAVERLRAAVTPPSEKLFQHRYQPWENVCTRLVIELGLLQAIASRDGAKVTAEELARETGHDELLIARIMRPLTNIKVNLFDEVGESTYAANETTTLLNKKGMIAGIKHYTDLLFPLAARLIPYIREYGTIKMFPEAPDEKGPFEYAFGVPIFEFFQRDAEQKEAFDAFMAGRRDATTIRWFDTYPAAAELGKAFDGLTEKDALIVDVGGNQGHDTLAFRKAHPDLPGRFIVQDLQRTFDNLEAPERFQGTNLELITHDFFTPQPVTGALAYFFRNICHDWPDAQCKEFLGHTAAAMTPGYSRVLIDDWVLPESNVYWRAASADITMLMYATGIERTHKQWEALLDAVGLKIVQVWGGPEKESVIEAMLK